MNHYTYMIRSSNAMFYIGARSCAVLPEEDEYYGSCDSFTAWQKENNEILDKHILGTFPSRALAIEHEIELHNFYDVAKNPLFWNKAKQTAVGFDTAGTHIPKSEEHKRKIGLAHRGRVISEEQKLAQSKKMKGRKLSAEHIEKVRLSNIGRKNSQETIEKMRISRNKRPPMSDETKEKISKSRSGVVSCFDTLEKKFITITTSEFHSGNGRYKANNSKEAKQFSLKDKIV